MSDPKLKEYPNDLRWIGRRQKAQMDEVADEIERLRSLVPADDEIVVKRGVWERVVDLIRIGERDEPVGDAAMEWLNKAYDLLAEIGEVGDD